MLELITDLFGIAKNSRGIVKDLQNLKSKARGIKNLILSEAEFNMDLILDHYFDKNVPEEIIIEKLRKEQLSKALEEGFDFTKVKKGKITAASTGDNPFLKKYVGYDCEA